MNKDKVKIAILEPRAYDVYPHTSEIHGGLSYQTPQRMWRPHYHAGVSLDYSSIGFFEGLTKSEIEEYVEIYLLPNDYVGMEWCRINEVDIISMSTKDWNHLGCDNVEAYEKELAKTTLMFTSAGNTGNYNTTEKRYESGAATRESWIAVGSLDHNYNPDNFSSHGLGYVFMSDIDDVDNDGGQDVGTSFSTPRTAGRSGVYYVKHLQTLGFKPTRDQAYEWMVAHCEDIHEIGNDLKTGEGIFRLPKVWEFEELIFQIGNPLKTTRKYVDGILVSEEDKETYTTPFLTNDLLEIINKYKGSDGYADIVSELESLGFKSWRTYMNPREIQEFSSCSLRYNSYDRKIYITK